MKSLLHYIKRPRWCFKLPSCHPPALRSVEAVKSATCICGAHCKCQSEQHGPSSWRIVFQYFNLSDDSQTDQLKACLCFAWVGAIPDLEPLPGSVCWKHLKAYTCHHCMRLLITVGPSIWYTKIPGKEEVEKIHEEIRFFKAFTHIGESRSAHI